MLRALIGAGKGWGRRVALAHEVVRLCEQSPEFTLPLGILSIEQKIQSIVRKIYHGDGVILTPMQNLKVSTGAGFIVALTGDIITIAGVATRACPRENRRLRVGQNFRVVLVL